MKNMEKENIYIFNSQLALPYLESEESVIEQIFKVLQNRFNLTPSSSQRFIDLGAGDGTVIIHCALNYDIHSVGIEIKQSLIEEVKARIKCLKKEKKENLIQLNKIKITKGDLFQQSLESFDFVYIFSLPTMQRFLNHIFQTAKKGTMFISYKYPLESFPYIKRKHIIDVNIREKKISAYFYRKTL